jgi:hypothetical protein
MELPSRAPCRVTVVEHGDMVTSEQNPCRFAILHRAIRTRRAGTFLPSLRSRHASEAFGIQ